MKCLFYLLVSLVIVYGCNDKKDLIKNKPPLRLKERIITSYNFNFGAVDTAFNTKTITKYDSLGNEIEELQKDKFGNVSITRKTDYKYLPNNKISEEIIYDSTGEPFSKHKYFYDSLGVLIREDIYQKKDPKYYTSEEFESKKYIYKDTLLVEEVVTPSNTRYLYKYDNNGFKIGEISYYDGDLGWITTIKNDSVGNMIYFKSALHGNKYANTRLYKYDHHKNKIQEISLDEDGKQVFRMTWKYNDQNQIVETMLFGKMDEPKSLSKYEYKYE